MYFSRKMIVVYMTIILCLFNGIWIRTASIWQPLDNLTLKISIEFHCKRYYIIMRRFHSDHASFESTQKREVGFANNSRPYTASGYSIIWNTHRVTYLPHTCYIILISYNNNIILGQQCLSSRTSFFLFFTYVQYFRPRQTQYVYTSCAVYIR